MNAHQELIDRWCIAFKERFRSPYVVQGGKDGIAVKRLLASGVTAEDAISNAKKAWDMIESPKLWNCNNQSSTLAGFAGAYSKIVVELSKAQLPALKRNYQSF
jgi:hypothetical protein